MINIICIRWDWANSVRTSFECTIIQWRKAEERQRPIHFKYYADCRSLVYTKIIFALSRFALFWSYFLSHKSKPAVLLNSEHWTIKKSEENKNQFKNKINFLILFMCIFIPRIERIEFGLWISVCVCAVCDPNRIWSFQVDSEYRQQR